ncbi:MAG TPA: cupin domain-containing protein [Thermomicrobiales bacterium]|nr:cupin domain-containing protein [Thermomicrobiales bacterium]
MEPEAAKPEEMVIAGLLGKTFQPEGACLSVAEWESGGEETEWISPLHIHFQDDEVWYVLAGRLEFRLNGEKLFVGAGGCVTAPRGVTHAFRNPGPGPVRYLLVMPDRVRRLVDAIHTEPRDEEAMKRLFQDHASELIGWPEN